MIDYDELYKPRQRPCPVCGSLTETKCSKPVMCEDCRRERDNENSKRRYARLRSTRDAKVKIIHDPLPYGEGGFRPGASITREELECGVHTHSFLLGTVFNVNGRIEVLRRINGKVRLVME